MSEELHAGLHVQDDSEAAMPIQEEEIFNGHRWPRLWEPPERQAITSDGSREPHRRSYAK